MHQYDDPMQDDRLAHGFNLAAPPPGFIDNPFPHYAALRRVSPVHEMAPGSWLLTRHDDVLATYRADARVDGALSFGMNAVIVAGIDCALRPGLAGRASYRFD